MTRPQKVTQQIAASQGHTASKAPQVRAEKKPKIQHTVSFFRLRVKYGTRVALETLLTRLPSALGVYSIPIMALGLVAFWKRRTWTEWFILAWIVLIWVPLLLTLPDHRYFMLSFPALALLAAHGLQATSDRMMQVLLLALLYCGGSLYLFVDWSRGTHLFLNQIVR
ncbi:hypothetical protein KFU94_70280 [Chloroflexi bacterium TSY]|nr:hypothetical protein [Chloroflexi bacterium TSY]